MNDQGTQPDNIDVAASLNPASDVFRFNIIIGTLEPLERAAQIRVLKSVAHFLDIAEDMES
jgi:hypothetical protein